MYKYEEPSLFSGKRGIAFIVVILIHVLVAYGFYSGLAQRIKSTIIPPVEVSQIDKPKDVDKPPPPPPKLEEIKPYVPPPEFVDIQQAAPEPTNQITTTQVLQAPPPVAQVSAPAPPPPPPGTPPRMDPKHPFRIGEDYYPDASKRAGEEGRCVVQMTVSSDGRVTSEAIKQSSGFPRLDEACLKGVHGQRMIPATEGGKPAERTIDVPIVWKLTNK